LPYYLMIVVINSHIYLTLLPELHRRRNSKVYI